MILSKLIAVIIYFVLLLAIAFFSYRKHFSSSDFIIGDRSLNYWLTALAAHASDMSSWLFMGYPAVIFAGGLFNAWTAIGLIVFMFLNWHLIAPRIRTMTEQYNSLTLSSFFESRFSDPSGLIRIFTAIMSFVFYTIYISAGLVGLGLLTETLFGINYSLGILIGILVVIPYVFIGGYVTLAWTDLCQGFFLLFVIVVTPFYLLPSVGGFDGVIQAMKIKHLSSSLIPHFSLDTFLTIFSLAAGWGLGYFGQPHILTKFMGIKDVKQMSKSKYIGMSWMTLSLLAATFIGMIAIAYFPKGIHDAELVFIQMVSDRFAPFLVGFILCAVLAATMSVMDSQILVLVSSLSEDFYKKIIHKDASSKELLLVSRLGVLLMGGIAFGIAYLKLDTIYSLVLYAWSGLGSSFGPLLIFALYSKKTSKEGAWAGILTGGIVSGVWPYFNKIWSLNIPGLIPGFALSCLAIWLASSLAPKSRGGLQQ